MSLEGFLGIIINGRRSRIVFIFVVLGLCSKQSDSADSSVRFDDHPAVGDFLVFEDSALVKMSLVALQLLRGQDRLPGEIVQDFIPAVGGHGALDLHAVCVVTLEVVRVHLDHFHGAVDAEFEGAPLKAGDLEDVADLIAGGKDRGAIETTSCLPAIAHIVGSPTSNEISKINKFLFFLFFCEMERFLPWMSVVSVTVSDTDPSILHGDEIQKILFECFPVLLILGLEDEAGHPLEQVEVVAGNASQLGDGDAVHPESGHATIRKQVEPDVGEALLHDGYGEEAARGVRVAGAQVGHGHEGLPVVGFVALNLANNESIANK